MPLVHLLPAGTFRGEDGRGPYRLDDADAVVARSMPTNARPLPVDYDHAIDLAAPNGHPAPAAGWIERLEARAGGIWGEVAWTDRAARAIAGREYLFASAVFEHGQRDGRILRILRAALTNRPNLPVTALAAAGGGHGATGAICLPLPDARTSELSAAERAICSRMGVPLEDYAVAKTRLGC